MRYASLSAFLEQGKAAFAKGPLALIFAEDPVEVDTTLRHHLAAGFPHVALLAPEGIEVPPALEALVHRVMLDVHRENAVFDAINAVIAAAPEIWLYYCYNAEYLFHPFCETRNVRELIAFHVEERRTAMLSYVIDLYADDLGQHPNAVSLERAHLTGRVITRWPGPIRPTTITPRSGNWISLADCAGGLKSMCR